jgi:hypothetical protein
MNELEQCLAMATGNRSRRSTRCVYNLIQNDIDAAYWKNPWGAQDYYVDGNRVTSGDGTSWDEAVDDLSDAITLSNASIGLAGNRWWARRNRIYACGDQELDENLTILPEKCDVIGVGTDLYPFPRVIGNHVIALAKVGCRFINMGFNSEANADMFDLPAGCYGLGFLGCVFTPLTAGTTKALEINDAALVQIIGCRFVIGAAGPTLFGQAIHFEGTIHHDCVVSNNLIIGTIGIGISEAGANCYGSIIDNNIIRATGLCIDDNSDDWIITNNSIISDAAGDGTGNDAVIDCNLQLAVGNRVTCSDHVNAPFPVQGTLT